jgi:hypothetical protein
VDICAKEYRENPNPRKLGNLYCFWYDKKNNPWMVIGPDWYFSVMAAIFFNLIGSALALYPPASNGRWDLFVGGVIVLFAQNFTYGMTVMKNPGLPVRDVLTHSKLHLNRVKTVE